jgi:hypothetical protein
MQEGRLLCLREGAMSGLPITRETFKGVKVVLSTPTMGMQVAEKYSDSFSELRYWFSHLGIESAAHRSRDTYVVRARNFLAQAFLATDAQYQIWLDSDMGWDTPDMLRMLYHAVTNPEIEVIGANYPQKHFDWQRVKETARNKRNVTPEQLECAATGMWTMKGIDNGSHDLGLPVELKQIGPQAPHVATGLMIVKRSAYERLMPTTPFYTEKNIKTHRFFHADIEDGLFVGEDTWFCRRHVEAGGKLWAALWVKSEHIGAVSFPGNISKLIDAEAQLPV